MLVGDTLIERERLGGYVETTLTLANPGRNVIFRNLGWSADNPLGQSRASFDWNKPSDEWFKLLTNQIAAVRPTLIVVGYGMADSFAGEAGLESARFEVTGQMSREDVERFRPRLARRFRDCAWEDLATADFLWVLRHGTIPT